MESNNDPYFNPYAEINRTGTHLPHWDQKGKAYFLTWRLGDALPQSKLDAWRVERVAWVAVHPEPWNDATEAEYHTLFSRRIDKWLDQHMGACVLKNPEAAKYVQKVLLHDHGCKYWMDSFVVMPNHVHALFVLRPEESLPNTLKVWKGISAYRVNQVLGREGSLWQPDYWDRLVRGEAHFRRCRKYILENPRTAGLEDGFLLWDSSAEGGHSCPPGSHPL